MAIIGAYLWRWKNRFPPALVDRINALNVKDVRAGHVKIGGVVAKQKHRATT